MSVAELFSQLSAMSSNAAWLPAVDIMLKVTVVLGAAAVATMALARASAASRHLIWTLALIGALLLPVLSLALPRWQLPIIRLAAQPQATSTAALEHGPIEHVPPPPLAPRAHRDDATSVEQAPAAAPPASIDRTAERSSMAPASVVGWLALVWAIGAVAIIARLLAGLAAVQWLSRGTARVIDAPWLPLAIELASRVGVSRQITFAESATASMPMAVGLFRPAVLMPADAVRWPVERLRIVLLHELAHVKRRDCLTHALAQLACAMHWFNPLAWIAARHVRTERERACDDLVLASGTKGPDYAEELLEIARAMRGVRFPTVMTGATLAMAHRSQLEGRLMAILDPKVPRSGPSALRTTFAATLAGGALLALSSLQPWTVAEAAATIETEHAQAESLEPASPPAAPQTLPTPPTPSPSPTPTPTPIPSPSPRQSIGQIASAAAAEAIAGIDQGAIQSAVQNAAQAATQSAVQGSLQWAIGAVAALEGRGGQEGRRQVDPRMIAALTAALKDSDKEVRETAMHALVQLRDPAIFEPLVLALKDTAHDVREQAAHGLGQLRDKRAVEPLIAALKDPNPSVREQVVHALSQLRDPRAVDGFIAALKDENPSVREQAAHALGQVRDPRSVDPLIAALKDENPSVREQAVHALSQVRDRRATAAVATLIKDSNPDVREQAVFALGQLRDPSAIEGLTEALRDSKADVREKAAFALGQIRDQRSVSPLISALKDENAEVRHHAAFALGQIRDKSAVEALIIAVRDPSAEVREQVVFALGQIRDPRAIEALTTALKDASADVRQQAAFALGQLAR
jgi:HEAT repeat protein/beta-lactamase regulating signal transducer with metallopeptidase domain